MRKNHKSSEFIGLIIGILSILVIFGVDLPTRSQAASPSIQLTTTAISFYNYLPRINRSEPPTSTPTPTIPPTPTKTPTPQPSNTPAPGNTGDINIINIYFDGVGSQEPDEYVEIRNDDSYPIQLAGWKLSDIANHVFTFPGFVIQPGQVCRVYTNQIHPEWCGFSYGSGSAIWNNSGDTATLRNASGVVIDIYTYP